MKKNMGFADRAIRLIIAAALVLLYSKGIISGTLGTLGLVFAGVFALTSVVRFCPIYPLLGINTAKKQ
ncbi:MAG: DUF2892 domain-containing protein [Flavobacterium sp.]|jgi:uncharacterized membrane protein required for colicin V production|uniref:YgaP family membrane protein n=1 Tax=Flavobacterium sp. TaxID=239 RepID=UPI0022BC8B4D|nr:DUF2892 domain-containing protein [Flavobacterium sp.]MCZ8168861.1 DUF2892 domain-containing protein [Flavobacterium sp.]MCZ8296802.1 DUF2892 domain-containing protein [Flavobacterium sp.]